MTSDAGDLVLVPFPFTDLSSKKTRPALVISSKRFNAAGADVILCAVTSNIANADHSVFLRPKDLLEGELKAPSRVKVGKIATVHERIIRKRIGRVRPSILDQVVRELSAIFPGYD